MNKSNADYFVAVAEQMSFVSAFLGGVSVTILVTIVIFTSSKKSVSWIVGTSALAACCLLTAVIASWRIIIAFHPDLPFEADLTKVEILWDAMILGYGLGVLSLITSIGLSGWLRSRRSGIITASIATVAVIFFLSTSIYN